MTAFQYPGHLSLLLQTYTHQQVRFITEFGLEGNKRITVHQPIDALVLCDDSLIKRGAYQCFLTAEHGASIQLWEYPEAMSFPPSGEWTKKFDESRRLLAEWPQAQIRWVLNAHALGRYEQTAPELPEWNYIDDW